MAVTKPAKYQGYVVVNEVGAVRIKPIDGTDIVLNTRKEVQVFMNNLKQSMDTSLKPRDYLEWIEATPGSSKAVHRIIEDAFNLGCDVYVWMDESCDKESHHWTRWNDYTGSGTPIKLEDLANLRFRIRTDEYSKLLRIKAGHYKTHQQDMEARIKRVADQEGKRYREVV